MDREKKTTRTTFKNHIRDCVTEKDFVITPGPAPTGLFSGHVLFSPNVTRTCNGQCGTRIFPVFFFSLLQSGFFDENNLLRPPSSVPDSYPTRPRYEPTLKTVATALLDLRPSLRTEKIIVPQRFSVNVIFRVHGRKPNASVGSGANRANKESAKNGVNTESAQLTHTQITKNLFR